LERPELTTGLDIGAFGGGGSFSGARVWSAEFDPTFEVFDDVARKFPCGWHFVFFVADRLEDQAVEGFGGIECGAGVTSASEAFSAIEPEVRFEVAVEFRFVGVAFQAMFDENGSDFRFEESDVFRAGDGGCVGRIGLLLCER
jgi:hypothetical protein